MTLPWNHRGEQPRQYKRWYHYLLCMLGLHYERGRVYDPELDYYYGGYCYRCGKTYRDMTSSDVKLGLWLLAIGFIVSVIFKIWR